MFGFGRIKNIEDWVHQVFTDAGEKIHELETRIAALEAKIPTVASVKAEVEAAVGVQPITPAAPPAA